MARWTARSDVGRDAAARDRLAVRVAEPDDDEVVRLQLVLAEAGRRHEDAIRVQADGDVALAGRDQPAAAESSPRAQHLLGRRRSGVHRHILRCGSGPSPGGGPMAAGRRRAARSDADAPVPSADAPGTHPRAAACPEPRLQGPAHEPGRLVARGRGQLRGAPAARPRPDRLGVRDGRRRGHPDAARPVLRDDRRRHRRPERSEADDVRGRPRPGRPDRADPALGRARRTDDGGHRDRDRPDGGLPVVLPGRLHRVRARRSSVGARSVAPTRTSRSSSRSASSSGRPSPACWRRPSARGRRSRSTRCRSWCRASRSRSSGATCGRPIERAPAPLLADIREGVAYIAGSPTLRSAIPFWVVHRDPPVAAGDRPHGRHHGGARLRAVRSSAWSWRPTASGRSSARSSALAGSAGAASPRCSSAAT